MAWLCYSANSYLRQYQLKIHEVIWPYQAPVSWIFVNKKYKLWKPYPCMPLPLGTRHIMFLGCLSIHPSNPEHFFWPSICPPTGPTNPLQFFYPPICLERFPGIFRKEWHLNQHSNIFRQEITLKIKSAQCWPICSDYKYAMYHVLNNRWWCHYIW